MSTIAGGVTFLFKKLNQYGRYVYGCDCDYCYDYEYGSLCCSYYRGYFYYWYSYFVATRRRSHEGYCLPYLSLVGLSSSYYELTCRDTSAHVDIHVRITWPSDFRLVWRYAVSE